METIYEDDDIHGWFGLTYSSYLVLQRSILQNAPPKWQKKFVKLLEELQCMTEDLSYLPDKYTVQCRDDKGRFVADPYSNYDRGRRFIALKKVLPRQ